AATTGGAEAAASAAGAAHLLHLRRGVAQGRADLVDLELVDGALLALARLVRPLAQPALHDHPSAALQRLGDVLGGVAPDVARKEEWLAVFPFARLPVQSARRGRDAELGN